MESEFKVDQFIDNQEFVESEDCGIKIKLRSCSDEAKTKIMKLLEHEEVHNCNFAGCDLVNSVSFNCEFDCIERGDSGVEEFDTTQLLSQIYNVLAEC